MSFSRAQMRYMNPYDIHKAIINDYVLKNPGDTQLFRRDASKDRTDVDVLRDNHRFLWDSAPDTWEAQFAKKYYDKLFREYCIADLTLYKENKFWELRWKIALRWRIEEEVISGKGQFVCGNKKCREKNELKTWEVNFAYREQGERRNALVKIRLCPECSQKLNYCSKKREVKRLKHKRKLKKRKSKEDNEGVDRGESSNNRSKNDLSESDEDKNESEEKEVLESPWEKHKPVDSKSRDEEMEDYLQDLLL